LDALHELTTVLIRVNSKNPSSVQVPDRFPQPDTAVDKARRAVREAYERAYDDKLMGVMAAAQNRYKTMTPEERDEYNYLSGLGREEQDEFRSLSPEARRSAVLAAAESAGST
jgi:hypothetical protein